MKKILDILMAAGLLFLMSFHLTGNKLHEWLGVAIILLMIIHNILNRKWYKAAFKGTYKTERWLLLITNILLAVTFIGIVISSLLISTEVFPFTQAKLLSFGRNVHMLCTAWIVPLVGIHIGFHISSDKKAVHIFGVIGSLLGIYAGMTHQLWQRMFMQVEFAFFDYSEPLIISLLSYLFILILFMYVSYAIKKILKFYRQ